MAAYIDNKKMLAAFVEHREKTQQARLEGKPDPQLPDYLGRCFLLMCEKIGTKYNFSGYSYLDEMRDDGLENCIIAANNFDPAKSSNPFGYFTKIIWFAFLRRIEKEKKQTVIKYKMMQKMYVEGSLMVGNTEDMKGIDLKIDNEFMDAAVADFDDKKKRKDAKSKATKAKKGLEGFFDGEKDEIDEEIDAIEIEDIPVDVLDDETRRTLGLQQTGFGISRSTGKKKSNGRQYRGD